MGIVYDAPSNTITVTGYTEGTPCTFLDIWNADQAGGWGVVSKQGDAQFLFDCLLQMGDNLTETWFADTNKQIVFADGICTKNGEKLIHVKKYATFRVGKLEDESKKTTSQGCHFICLESTYNSPKIPKQQASDAHVYLYSSTWSTPAGIGTRVESRDRIWNCSLLSNTYISETYADIYNVYITAAYAGFASSGPSGVDKLTITECSYMIRTYADLVCSISSVLARGCSKLMNQASDRAADSHLLNVDSDTWVIGWPPASTGKIYRQYTFNLKVVDSDGAAINGVAVKLHDIDENEVFSVQTGGDGKIAEQTVSRGFYAQASGNTLQDYGPFKLELTKTGYKPLTIEGIVLADPVDWVLELLAWSEVLTDVGDSVDIEIPDESLDMDIPDDVLEMEVVE